MNETLLTLILLASPALLLTAAFAAKLLPQSSIVLVKKLSLAASAVSIVIALTACAILVNYQLAESSFIGINGLGFSLRLDAISVTMSLMIALISFIVVKFSCNYLDGDPGQNVFLERLTVTIASVQLLVLSGNLAILFIAWVLTSIALQRLLLFYPDRPGAIIASRKKFIVVRLADACLAAAIILLYKHFGTGNLQLIFQQIRSSLPSNSLPAELEAAALFLAFAAILKSAQFPTHGWLLEVMETPTPVSALLHAGLLNAGPLLIIRMAFLMDASTYASLLLIAVGGFTALFASAAFLTQTSIKTALSYSSIAHMGFSLMVCGLGVFPAAMLHLVAHSFYKAHAFLSSGSVIDVIRGAKVTQLKRRGKPVLIIAGIILTGLIYNGMAYLMNVHPANDLSTFAIGAIMVMSLTRIFTTVTDSDASLFLMLRASALALLTTTSFFILESLSSAALSAQIPSMPHNSFIKEVFIYMVLLSFTLTMLIQIIAPLVPEGKFTRAMAVHLRNGFYMNTYFDKIIGALSIFSTSSKSEHQTVSEPRKSGSEPAKYMIFE
ncbi:proton-conducting transporter transmembrane domain-containing protein [Desertivirga brevis]|uniref:proton-conducting transporter transmembrane domain-containing protein n=1 Tax=Desertivirga brevis TaxID=2810310 RepID=UPI001A978FCA|nr:proton-conducting transporter membrane subunit [Pedobacter sp. SYSU D00873]